MLLTLDNLANRGQYINAKNTFEELLRCAPPPAWLLERAAGAWVLLSTAGAAAKEHGRSPACTPAPAPLTALPCPVAPAVRAGWARSLW